MHLDSADTNQKYTFGYIQTILCFLRVWCSHFGQFFGHAYGTTQLGSELIGHCHIYIYIYTIVCTRAFHARC